MNNNNNSSSSSSKRDFEISKYLSTVLRHRAEEMKLPIRHDGYLPVNDLLQLRKLAGLHTTFDDIQRVVAENNKSRFHLMQEGSIWLIRANQGHSMANLEVDMKEITLEQAASYPEVIHGTYKAAWELIKHSGLNRMSRVHIHCATGLNAKSGMRKDCEVVIYIDMRAAIRDGIKFLLSENGVVLTEGVNGTLDKMYFLKVESRDGSVVYLDNSRSSSSSDNKNNNSNG